MFRKKKISKRKSLENSGKMKNKLDISWVYKSDERKCILKFT